MIRMDEKQNKVHSHMHDLNRDIHSGDPFDGLAICDSSISMLQESKGILKNKIEQELKGIVWEVVEDGC